MSIVDHPHARTPPPTRSVPVWDRVERLLHRFALPALRISLGLVFVWFGTLKIVGESPVADLVRATLPWFDNALLVPALGWLELVLGLILLTNRFQRLALITIAAHLTGTFLTFIDAPSWVIAHGNPLLLTGNGEFVLKNLVLVCAALVLLTRSRQRHSTS